MAPGRARRLIGRLLRILGRPAPAARQHAGFTAHRLPPDLREQAGQGPPARRGAPAPRTTMRPQRHAADRPRTRVHGERLDGRSQPLRLTPSEALTLAVNGPSALRRHAPPQQPDPNDSTSRHTAGDEAEPTAGGPPQGAL